MLVGPKDFIDYGRRIRKALGGGMRQVGVLAAAGLIALTEMTGPPERGPCPGQDAGAGDRRPSRADARPGQDRNEHHHLRVCPSANHDPGFLEELKKRGILGLAARRRRIRMVTHKDVDDEDVDRAIAAFSAILILPDIRSAVRGQQDGDVPDGDVLPRLSLARRGASSDRTGRTSPRPPRPSRSPPRRADG